MDELAAPPLRRRAPGSAPAGRAPARPRAGRRCAAPRPARRRPALACIRSRSAARSSSCSCSSPAKRRFRSTSARQARTASPPLSRCRSGRGAGQRLRLVLDGQDAVADREPVAHRQILQARARSRRRYGRNGSSRRGSRSRARQSRRSGRSALAAKPIAAGISKRRGPRRSRRSRRPRRARARPLAAAARRYGRNTAPRRAGDGAVASCLGPLGFCSRAEQPGDIARDRVDFEVHALARHGSHRSL